MANTAVSGRVIDTTATARPGLKVRVFDKDVWPFRELLGEGVTGADGRFLISYSAQVYGPRETLPDIVVEIRGGGSVLLVTEESGDVAAEVLDLGDLLLSGKNIGVQGRVIDEAGTPVAGLIIDALDNDLIGGDVLGRTVTDIDGTWSLAYAPAVYEELKERPDIVVTVLDRVGIRELARTTEAANVTASILILEDIVVPRAAAEGWLATLGAAAPSRLSVGNAVEVLIDNQRACRRMVQLIGTATSEVHLAQLSIDTGFIATFTGDHAVATDGTNTDDLILESLLQAGRRTGVTVRVLMNENAIVPDTFDEVSQWFTQRMPRSVTVRAVPLYFETMHAKLLIVDPGLPTAKAMIIGSPFEQGYWDTRAHSLIEPRRGVDGASGIGLRPVHEVSACLTGPCTADVADTFAMLWNRRSDVAFSGADKLPLPGPRPTPVADQSIQIVRSIPRRVVPGLSSGEAGVLEAYERAIGAATDVIYLENQYFSSGRVVRALRRAIASNPSLQVILLINEHPDIPTYRYWQHVRLFLEIGLPHSQVGAFTLWQTGLDAARVSIQQVYVHSKVGIVDTAWATVGTANLDGISMEGAAELYRGRKRSVEVNAVLLDGVADQPRTGATWELRQSLWSEHLGQVPNVRPPDGWLSLWEQAAAENVAALNSDQPRMIHGRVLPYRSEGSAMRQLDAMGIQTERLAVYE